MPNIPTQQSSIMPYTSATQYWASAVGTEIDFAAISGGKLPRGIYVQNWGGGHLDVQTINGDTLVLTSEAATFLVACSCVTKILVASTAYNIIVGW